MLLREIASEGELTQMLKNSSSKSVWEKFKINIYWTIESIDIDAPY